MSRLVTAADKAVSAIHIQAPNDTNGNPRRGWVIRAADGRMIEWIEEGYEGFQALVSRWPQYGYEARRYWNGRGANLPAADDIGVNVAAAEYKRLRRCGESLREQWQGPASGEAGAGMVARADKRQAATRAARDDHGLLPR